MKGHEVWLIIINHHFDWFSLIFLCGVQNLCKTRGNAFQIKYFRYIFTFSFTYNYCQIKVNITNNKLSGVFYSYSVSFSFIFLNGWMDEKINENECNVWMVTRVKLKWDFFVRNNSFPFLLHKILPVYWNAAMCVMWLDKSDQLLWSTVKGV